MKTPIQTCSSLDVDCAAREKRIVSLEKMNLIVDKMFEYVVTQVN